MRKGTFGHMQKVYTQTSHRVSDAASGQSLHFLTLVTSIAQIIILQSKILDSDWSISREHISYTRQIHVKMTAN